METLATAAVLILGLVLRLGVPALLTVGVVRWLRHVDARWQVEAREENARLRAEALASARPCWEVRGCSPETRAQCAAYLNPQIACWQQFRNSQGQLRDGCLTCEVFKLAPVLAH